MNYTHLRQTIIAAVADLGHKTDECKESVLIREGFFFGRQFRFEGVRAVWCSRSHFTLRAVLRIVGLSHTRYHAWSNETTCGLNDRPSCPRSSPQQLTLSEVQTIRDMATSDEYRHVPTGILARLF